jgi:hypothetical protein
MEFLKNRWVRRGVALVLLILAVLFLINQINSHRVAAQEEKVKAMTRELSADFSPLEMIKNFKKRDPSRDAERRERLAKLREETDKLPRERQRALRMQMGSEMMSKMADTFWKMPKAQQDAALNLMIDLMESGRKEQQQRANADNANRDERRRPRTDEERFEWFKDFLNNTTPEDRAKMGELFRRLNELRQSRGLPPMQPGGPRRAN